MMSSHALYEPADLAKVTSRAIPTSSCFLRLSRTRRRSEELRTLVSAAAIAVSSPPSLHVRCQEKSEYLEIQRNFRQERSLRDPRAAAKIAQTLTPRCTVRCTIRISLARTKHRDNSRSRRKSGRLYG
ncbi:hypothetical protein KM043_013530 [Ampulex compressa]|nr:hypothetical protein KM043_013530 [Ampulex compressa]